MDSHKIYKKSTNWYGCSDIKEKILEIHKFEEKKVLYFDCSLEGNFKTNW